MSEATVGDGRKLIISIISIPITSLDTAHFQDEVSNSTITYALEVRAIRFLYTSTQFRLCAKFPFNAELTIHQQSLTMTASEKELQTVRNIRTSSLPLSRASRI